MIKVDEFTISDKYGSDINYILEESNCCLQSRDEMIGYKNPICRLIKVEKEAENTIYTFEIWEDGEVYKVDPKKLQNQSKVDLEKAFKYAKEMEEGAIFPPIIVHRGQVDFVFDGSHRVTAALMLGLTEIEAYVVEI